MLKFQLLIPLACFSVGWAIGIFYPTSPGAKPAPPEISNASPVREKQFTPPSIQPTLEEPPLDTKIDIPKFLPPYEESLGAILARIPSKEKTAEAELRSALGIWLVEDEQACLGFLAQLWVNDKSLDLLALSAVTSHAKTLDDSALQEFISVFRLGSRGDGHGTLLKIAAERSWSEGEDEVLAFVESLPPHFQTMFLTQASVNCPDLNREAWVNRLVALRQFHPLRQMTLADPEAMKPILQTLINQESEHRDALLESGIYNLVKYKGTEGKDLAEILNQLVDTNLSDESDEAKRSQELSRLLQTRVTDMKASLISTHRDSLEDFKQGKLDADDFLKTVMDGFDDLKNADPNQVRTQILPILAAANPSAAVAWIADMPITDRTKAIYAAATTMTGSSSDPERFMAFLDAYPYDPSQGPLQDRFRLVTGLTDNSYKSLGNSYAEWLIQRPTSVDRDMALGSLAHDMKDLHPALSERLFKAKNFKPPSSK